MNPEPGGAPAPEAPETSGTPGPVAGSDEAEAQNYFDEWSERVDSDISNLKEALAHLMQVQGPGGPNNGGHSSIEPQAGASAGQQNQVSSPAGAGGQPLAAAAGEQPEQAPKSAHPYWKRLWGG